jgi:hypothetical protein
MKSLSAYVGAPQPASTGPNDKFDAAGWVSEGLLTGSLIGP